MANYKARLRPLLVIVFVPLVLLCLTGLTLAFSKSEIIHFDFRTQYAAGYMVRTGDGHRLYDYDENRRVQSEKVGPSELALPFIHIAYEALLYVPFSLLSYQSAYYSFLVINFLVLIWCYHMLRPHLSSLVEVWVYLPAAILGCFLPVIMALVQGQSSILLLAIVILVSVRLDRGQDAWAGFFLGLSCTKFQYAVPIALLFLVWRRWRFVGGFAISAALVAAISVCVTGITGLMSYAHLLGSMSAHFSSQNGMSLGIRPELMPNLRGLIYGMGGGASRTTNLITFILSISVFLWAAIKPPSLPLALLTASLVSYHSTFTDATLLILPITVGLATFLQNSTGTGPIAATCAIVFVAPAPLLLTGVRFHLLAVPIFCLFCLWDLVSPTIKTAYAMQDDHAAGR